MASKTLRNTLLLLAKAAVSSLLLVLIFRKIDVAEIVSHFGEMDPWMFGLSSLLYIGNLYLTAVRWRMILGSGHPIGPLFSLCLIGAFFNNLLPGSVGGDAMKAYYLYRDTKEGGKSIASVFLDRYIGFFAMLSIGVVSGAVAFRELAAVKMEWISPLLFAGFLGASLAVFGLRIGRRFATVAAFYDFFHDRIRDRSMVVRAYFLSTLIQTISIAMVFCIARGLGQQVSFAALFVFLPIIFTVIAVPISISGLGLRESAFVLLFGLTGVSAATSTSISFLWFLSVATGSLPGLWEYFRRSRRKTAPPS